LPRIKQQFDAMRSATKEKIIAAGLQLFASKGLAATSIQDIAALAGISTGLMYHYYESKEDLFHELAETAVDSATESTLLIFDSDQSPAEKFKAFSKEVIGEIGRADWMSQLYLLMIHYMLEVAIPAKASAIQERAFAPLESVKRTILEGQALGEIKPGDPEEMAVIYFAAIQGLAIYRLTMGDRFILPGADLLNRLVLKIPENGD
jgi:AcrR family transcriptional regulator